MWNTHWPAGKIRKPRFLDSLKLNYKEIFFGSPVECFWFHYFIANSFPIQWHFSLHFLKNTRKLIFLKRTMFRTNHFMTKCFFNNIKMATENNSICCFLAATQGLTLGRFLIVWTPAIKLIIASAVIKDVYICPCISLFRHHMQIYGC